jgi:hypothetical protein
MSKRSKILAVAAYPGRRGLQSALATHGNQDFDSKGFGRILRA